MLFLSRLNHLPLPWVRAVGVQTPLRIIGYSFRDEKSFGFSGDMKRKT
jgi:hypothetical protein